MNMLRALLIRLRLLKPDPVWVPVATVKPSPEVVKDVCEYMESRRETFSVYRRRPLTRGPKPYTPDDLSIPESRLVAGVDLDQFGVNHKRVRAMFSVFVVFTHDPRESIVSYETVQDIISWKADYVSEQVRLEIFLNGWSN